VLTLDLVPIYAADHGGVMRDLHARLERSLHAQVRERTPWFDPERAFDPSRGQYDSTRLLELLLAAPDDAGERVLGVAGVDLFIPVLTYVFGEAQLQGRVAVVSLHRLRPEAYGLPRDPRLVLERLEKESLHELGHTFGLVHCVDGGCVMHVSTYVEEIDLKPASFCASCVAGVPVNSEARGCADPTCR
jgi:archaemetzincin